jgi:hypothetical protein
MWHVTQLWQTVRPVLIDQAKKNTLKLDLYSHHVTKDAEVLTLHTTKIPPQQPCMDYADVD